MKRQNLTSHLTNGSGIKNDYRKGLLLMLACRSQSYQLWETIIRAGTLLPRFLAQPRNLNCTHHSRCVCQSKVKDFMRNLSVRAVFALLLVSLAPASWADIPALLGSGNISVSETGSVAAAKYAILSRTRSRLCRFNVYPNDYYQGGDTSPELLDEAMLQAQRSGITPVLLFEHDDNTHPVGDYHKWYAIGWQFANRFRPNSPWWQQHGVTNFGVTLYQAFNEPDIVAYRQPNLKLDLNEYHDAMQGLADGVHAVQASLKVVPGGYGTPNAYGTVVGYGAMGYGRALQDLFNNGALDGVNIHTYFHNRWAPLVGTYTNSAQYKFDQFKQVAGITRDINFYCAEYNYSRRISDDPVIYEQDSVLGERFLTGLWDVLGVVHADGKSATRAALVWGLIDTESAFDKYGFSEQLNPWIPSARGQVYELVTRLTQGLNFTSLDPKRSGVYVLSGTNKKLWVWQDRAAWTNKPGTSFTLTNIPVNTTRIEVYGWDGLRKTVSVAATERSKTISVPGNETYMFLAVK